MENANLPKLSPNQRNPLHNLPFPLQNEILRFQQHHDESFPEAWTRIKYLLQKVLYHGIDLLFPLQFFYTRIAHETQRRLDYVADGDI